MAGMAGLQHHGPEEKCEGQSDEHCGGHEGHEEQGCYQAGSRQEEVVGENRHILRG
jgi:hypothetical protein